MESAAQILKKFIESYFLAYGQNPDPKKVQVYFLAMQDLPEAAVRRAFEKALRKTDREFPMPAPMLRGLAHEHISEIVQRRLCDERREYRKLIQRERRLLRETADAEDRQPAHMEFDLSEKSVRGDLLNNGRQEV